MSNALAIRNEYPVVFDWLDPETGHLWVHLSLNPPFDWDQVKALPKVLAFDGDRFVRTGWNSDKGEVYYRNHMPLASRAIDDALRNVQAMMDTPVGRRKYHSEFEQDVLDSVLKALQVLEG